MPYLIVMPSHLLHNFAVDIGWNVVLLQEDPQPLFIPMRIRAPMCLSRTWLCVYNFGTPEGRVIRFLPLFSVRMANIVSVFFLKPLAINVHVFSEMAPPEFNGIL